MLSESFTLVRAHGVRKIGEGGGDENEDINVHLVARADIPNFIEQKRAEGFGVDVKLLHLHEFLNARNATARWRRVQCAMARLVHFPTCISALTTSAGRGRRAEVDVLKPDLVVISGDFTQRARTEQFKEACEFLERLRERGHEVLGVPGNHDVPLYDVLRRFLSPLTRYRRYIDETCARSSSLPGSLCSASTPLAR